MNYLVTVIIPVHNTASYLRKCVESVLAQTLKEIEVILVDNLSTDGSAEMCDHYAEIDTRIKVLHLTKAGLSIARNAGIDVASAPFVGFVDSDDYVSSNMYEEMYNVAEELNADIVYSNFQIEHTNGSAETFEPNQGGCLVRSPEDVVRDMLCDRLNYSVCTKLYRKELFEHIRFPEGKLYEDRLVAHQWILQSHKIAWIDKPFYHYVERENSICHTVSSLNLYHYFMAEYFRLKLIDELALFNEKEAYEQRNRLLSICFSIFNQYMLVLKKENGKGLIREMRSKFASLLSYRKEQLSLSFYKRLRKITYFWTLYRWMHYRY